MIQVDIGNAISPHTVSSCKPIIIDNQRRLEITVDYDAQTRDHDREDADAL